MTGPLQRARAGVSADLARKVADAIGDELGDAGLTPDALDRAARAAVVAHQLHALAVVVAEAAPAEAPASPGVPRCPGEIWTTSTDQMIPCTLPLGHHGGCR